MKHPQSSPASQSADERRSAYGGMRKKRRDKMIDAHDIRLLILHFLSHNAAHGYELIKAIEELSKGEYTPSPGIIYPSLALLEETGSIYALDERATRKAYALAEQGRTLLAQHQADLTVVIERLTSLTTLVNNRSIPEVERAINNMKAALNARLAEKDLSRQTLHAIIDAMDDAAKKIERS